MAPPRKVVQLVLIVALIGGVGYGLGYYFYYNPVFFANREPMHFFWLSSMFTDDALPLIEQYTDQIDIISPTWYALAENGSAVNHALQSAETHADMDAIIAICNTYGIPIHPLVGGGNASVMRALLEDTTRQAIFIAGLVTDCSTYGFGGINIDFEGVPEDLREEFTNFFGNLKVGLGANIMLSIDVPIKVKDDTTGWAGWCDYEALGEIADLFMIMAYDYHGGWGEPGEVAPTSGVKKMLACAVRAVPLEKIYCGIPMYGYDWSDDPAWENWGFGYGYFADKVNRYGGLPTRTYDGKELYYKYTDDAGYGHICYYCDAETTWAKEAFLSKYPIGGYCYWHLSCGDPAYFIN